MKIDFDTSNTAEVTAVLALARSLSGDAIDVRTFADPNAAPVYVGKAIEEMDLDFVRHTLKPYVTTPEHAADVAARNAEPVPNAETVAAMQDVLDGNTEQHSDVPALMADLNAPTLDSNGREWDERIHSSSRAVNADGSWRYKRGVDKALVAAIESGELDQRQESVEELEAQMREQMAGNAPQSVASVPPPPPVAAAPVEQPGQQPGTPALTFADLMKRIGAAKRDGTLTDEQVASYCGALGIGGLADLASRADLVPAFGELVA